MSALFHRTGLRLTPPVKTGRPAPPLEKSEAYEMVIRSTNNLPDAKTVLVNYVNIRDLLRFDKIVIPLKALDVLTSTLGR